MYFWSNKKDLNQKSRRTSKNERFLTFWWKTPPNVWTRWVAYGHFQKRHSQNCDEFFYSNLFIRLRDVWTSCKRHFWVGGRFFALIGGGFLAENQKNHLFALYGRSKNRSKKARFWPSRSSKLNGWGGCVLCLQLAVHRGLISILCWIYGFGKKRFELIFAYFWIFLHILHIFAYFCICLRMFSYFWYFYRKYENFR